MWKTQRSLLSATKLLHPNLYPYASECFIAHERLSLLAPILAWTARLTHLSTDWTVFLWYIVTLFATLMACWMLAVVCFDSPRSEVRDAGRGVEADGATTRPTA